MGRVEGDDCNGHGDCNAGLACIVEHAWPFKGRCKTKLYALSSCQNDYECDTNYACWYQVLTGTNPMCLMKYNMTDFTRFPWDLTAFPTYELTKEAVLYHGKFCQSGIANRFSPLEARCVRIDNIRLSIEPNTRLSNPYECNANGLTQCRYQNNDTVMFSLPCECGYNNKSYCPLPSTVELTETMRNILILGENDKCNTLDRDNVRAQKDCGLGAMVDYEEDFSDAVQSKFELQFWTYTRTDESLNCMKRVFPQSQYSLLSTGAYWIMTNTIMTMMGLLIALHF